jgi:hypothetical protein
LLGAIVAANALVVAMVWTPPELRPPVDLVNEPFVGQAGVSAWLAPPGEPMMYGGRVRAHRVWVLLTAVAAALLSVASIVAHRPLPPPSWRKPPRIVLAVGSRAFKVVAALLIGICVVSGLNLGKTPSFVSSDSQGMHTVLNHYELLAPADRVAAGDRLLIDIQPSYGALWPLVMGAYQRAYGLVSMGAVIQVLIQTNTLFMIIFTAAMYQWARGRMIAWVPPLIMVLGYYISVETFLVPPNHCMIRVGGLVAAPAAWLIAVRMRPVWGCFALGATAALALINNFETGAAVAAGTAVVGFFRWFLPAVPGFPRQAGAAVGACTLGFLAVMGFAEMVAVAGLGQVVPLRGLILPSVNAGRKVQRGAG